MLSVVVELLRGQVRVSPEESNATNYIVGPLGCCLAHGVPSLWIKGSLQEVLLDSYKSLTYMYNTRHNAECSAAGPVSLSLYRTPSPS